MPYTHQEFAADWEPAKYSREFDPDDADAGGVMGVTPTREGVREHESVMDGTAARAP